MLTLGQIVHVYAVGQVVRNVDSRFHDASRASHSDYVRLDRTSAVILRRIPVDLDRLQRQTCPHVMLVRRSAVGRPVRRALEHQPEHVVGTATGTIFSGVKTKKQNIIMII